MRWFALLGLLLPFAKGWALWSFRKAQREGIIDEHLSERRQRLNDEILVQIARESIESNKRRGVVLTSRLF